MDYFLEQLRIILPVLGVNVIRTRRTATGVEAPHPTVSPIFSLRNKRHRVEAQAQQIDGEFTMLAGSIVVPRWQGAGAVAVGHSCNGRTQWVCAEGTYGSWESRAI